MPQLSLVEPADQPLSGARRDLRLANAALAAATAELRRLQAPESRLRGVIAAAEAVERELSELRALDDQRLVEWMVAGAVSLRPEPSTNTLDCERRCARLAKGSRRATFFLKVLR